MSRAPLIRAQSMAMTSPRVRCRFVVDFHFKPCRSLKAIVIPEDKKQPTEQETIGAVWPPGASEQSVVFQVKHHDPLSNRDFIEFTVSRSFIEEFRVKQNKDYFFEEFEHCPTLTRVVLEGDADAVREAGTAHWLSENCESLVHLGSSLGGLTVTHVFPYSFGLISLPTELTIVETKVPGSENQGEEETGSLLDPRDTLCFRPITNTNDYRRIEDSVSRALAEAEGAVKFDLNRCVFVSSRLIEELDLTPFAWVRLKTGGGRSRQVRLIPAKLAATLEDIGVQGTWQLVFNVSSIQQSSPCELEAIELDVPFAKTATVSLAISPANKTAEKDVASMLQHYFRKPRLLSVGDVFAISRQNFLEDQSNNLKQSRDARPPLYFVVRELMDLGESLWVQKGETSLVEKSPVARAVPTFAKATSPYHRIFNTAESVFQKVREVSEVVKVLIDKRGSSSSSLMNNLLFLISGPSKSGKTLAVQTIAHGMGLQLRTVNGDDLTGETAATAETRIKNSLEEISSYGSCVLHLKDVDLMFEHIQDKQDTRLSNSFVNSLKQLVFNKAEQSRLIVVIMTTTNSARIPSQVMAQVLYQVDVKDFSIEERIEVLKILLCERRCSSLFDWKTIATMTNGFILGDLVGFATSVRRCMRTRLGKLGSSKYAKLCGPLVTMEDAMTALKKIQIGNNKIVGAPQIPSVKWSDVGGLEDAKKNILDTIQSPLRHLQLAESALTRSGVLLYGPPGTGKTLLAKAVATECSLNFLSVKGPELINMYVGQSEENVRKVFEKARSVEPCIIFFDELDSLAPSRGRSADSGGVLDRVVSQLLAEMDGLTKSKQVFVIGATNRPDLLDSAVLRPGRLDRLIYVDIPEEPDVKLKVLKALTHKMKLDNVDLKGISERCPKTYTGADLYSLCATAMTAAISRCIATDQSVVILQDEDFERGLKENKPSVGDEELAHYRNLRKQFGH